MDDISYHREQAEKCRRMARMVCDASSKQRLLGIANDHARVTAVLIGRRNS